MTLRFCPQCSAEVQVSDGLCLLGHPVTLSLPTEPLGALGGADEPVRRAPEPPPRPPGSPVPLRPARALKPDPGMLAYDPIAAFAPYPRMNWGPDRGARLRALLTLRRRTHRERLSRLDDPEA